MILAFCALAVFLSVLVLAIGGIRKGGGYLPVVQSIVAALLVAVSIVVIVSMI